MSALLMRVGAVAAIHALRLSIADLGYAGCALRRMRVPHGVYYAREMRRVICVKFAFFPSLPEFVSPAERHVMRRLAARLGAQSWEARIALRPGCAPFAVIWRRLCHPRAR